MQLALLSAHFQSLPLLPTSKLGLSGADSWVGGFLYVLNPVGLSNELFSKVAATPTGFYSQKL